MGPKKRSRWEIRALPSAEFKLALLGCTQPSGEIRSMLFIAVAREYLQAISHHSLAATGSGASDQLRQEWQSVHDRAAGGDGVAFQQLKAMFNAFYERWVPRNNALANELKEHKAQAEHTRRKVTRARFIALALQILGLVIVLMKDLPRPANTAAPADQKASLSAR